MKNTIIVSFLVLSLIAAHSAFAATDYLLNLDGTVAKSVVTDTSQPTEGAVACTMDAKACPDGSYVGRTAPSCAFAPCPGESSAKVVPPLAPKPTTPPPSGDPDFDLLKTTPPPPLPAPMGDPDFDLLKISPSPTNPIYKDTGTQGENPMHESDKKMVPPPGAPTDSKKGSVEYGWKVEEGTKLQGVEPDEIDYRDDDDDADGILSKTEDEDTSVSVKSVIVRGWDPKKKEEFMSERKEAAEVHSKQELEHFAQGILLDDEKIEDVQFNPKELSVSYEAGGKFLGFIPLTYTERLTASGEEGGEITFATKKPWWGFLVRSNDDGDEVANSAKKKHKETMQIESWSFGASNQASMLKTISNVLKTKHDTAKNSVGNIR